MAEEHVASAVQLFAFPDLLVNLAAGASVGDLARKLTQQAVPFGHGLFAAPNDFSGAHVLALGFIFVGVCHGASATVKA